MSARQPAIADTALVTAIDAVIEAGRRSAERGWVPATSGNFSVRVDAERIAVTRSGVDKGRLTPNDVLCQQLSQPLVAGSSAEAELHRRLYADDAEIGAVFHTHAVSATVLAQLHRGERLLTLSGWELQKALAGIRSHETVVEVPIVANDQDVVALANEVAARLAAPVAAGAVRAPGYLIAGHGLYAWGHTAVDAFRHLEALDVLFTQILTLRRHAS